MTTNMASEAAAVYVFFALIFAIIAVIAFIVRQNRSLETVSSFRPSQIPMHPPQVVVTQPTPTYYMSPMQSPQSPMTYVATPGHQMSPQQSMGYQVSPGPSVPPGQSSQGYHY